MNISIIFLCISLIYSIFLNFFFFSKKHINTYETKIFSILVFTNFLGLILEFLCLFFVTSFGTDFLGTVLINKLFLMYLLTFAFIFGLYLLFVCFMNIKQIDDNKALKKLRTLIFFVYVICILLIIVLPVKFSISVNYSYSYGPAVNVVYIASFIYSLICFISMLVNLKNIIKKRYVLIFTFFIGLFLTAVVQKIWPQLTLATSMETILIFLMFNTIENPDVKMIEQLEFAKTQAEKANNAKTDFLSSMSHEIRTPLNAIVGFSECIEDAKNLDEAKENAKDIVMASNTLLEIVNGILDISKIEAGKLEIVNSAYEAKEVFVELAKLIMPRMREKNLEFTYFIAPDLPNVLYGDCANIKKIITNLLSNAYKYTSRGYVRFEVNCVNSNENSKLIISVEDTGRGIKSENVDKLFTKFERIDEDRNTTIEGTGLGLAITKQLVELMGGRIIVHTIFGEGSKFTVILNQKIGAEKDLKRKITYNKKIEEFNLKGVKILLVDDNELNIKVTNKLLEKFGADSIVNVTSGSECLNKIQALEKYDVILLDIMMPKMSGEETLEKLKEIPDFNIPVVALTANVITGMKEKYLEEGFIDYLAKPIEKEQLINVLSKILYNKRDIAEKSEEKIVDKKQEEILEPPTIDNIEFLKSKGVQIEQALEYLGDIATYNFTVKEFSQEIEEKINELEKYKLENDMENYAILVHSLKSDAKYLGFMKFADIAYQHELKSKEKNKDYINANFARLEEELSKCVNVINDYLQKIDKDSL